MDTDVFIQSKNGPYAFDIAPGFWKALETAASRGLVCSSKKVYKELMDYYKKDELKQWAQERNESGFFVEVDEPTQLAFKEIADHVQLRYDPAHAAAFLGCADPWLVAHAKAEGAIVVTHETLLAPDAKKVKIPNVCNHFAIECIPVHEMLRRLRVELK
jgi:hypothetical protein